LPSFTKLEICLPVRRLCIQLTAFAYNCNSTSYNYKIICFLLMEYFIIFEIYHLCVNVLMISRFNFYTAGKHWEI
ncbi:hypothetical protein T4E_8902, partial [Trichinella pseudospiralis]